MSVVKMCMLRWMCGNTWRDKVRNDDIFIKISITPIEEKMRENCLCWFDYVQRTSTDVHDAHVRRVELINLGQIKRAKGKLKKTWMKMI